LLKKINPPKERRDLARDLVRDLRNWLQDHDFGTVDPHTLLIGSYARSTAVLWIKDVDVLVLLPESALERTPHAVLLELRKVLEGYPDAVVSALGQRRSIRIEFEEYDFFLDVVPAVAPDGLDEPLKIPDRPKAEWIDSDPLGYMERLSALNQEHARGVVRLIKLIKAWRDEQMKIRRPKSYMLEVMVVNAIEDERISLDGESWPSVLAQLFSHWAAKYHGLMEDGEGVPRIYDPQLGHLISAGWTRPEFETFMHRVREAERAARRALAAETEVAAAEEWKRVFGACWPTDDEVEQEAEHEAAERGPGRSKIASVGWVTGPAAARTIATQRTSYHGERR
jgi:hypothetical protein